MDARTVCIRKGKTVNKHWFPGVIAGTYLLAMGMSLIQGKWKGDERIFHYPLTAKFAAEFPRFDLKHNYSSASSPLPYIVAASLGRVVGLSVASLRCMNLALSLAALWMFLRLARLLGVRHPREVSLLLLFHPYFLLCSVVFYTPMWGMTFGLFSLYFFLRDASRYDAWLAGAWSAAAVLSRQFDMFLPAGFVLLALRDGWTAKRAVPWGKLAALCAPQVLPLLLFMYWGGISSPDFTQHEIGLKPMNLVFFVAMVGFYYGWTTLYARFPRRHLLWLAVGLPPFFLFMPNWSDYQGMETMTGLVMHVCSLGGRFVPGGTATLVFGLYVAGFVVLVDALRQARETTPREQALWLLMALFLGVMSVNVASAERHFVGCIPLLILALRRPWPGLAIRLAGAVTGFVSFAYLFFWLFISNK